MEKLKKMTTINLHQDKTREDMRNNIGRVNTSLIIAMVLGGLLLLVWVGLKYSISSIDKKTMELNAQIETESAKLGGQKSLDQVTDLQERLAQIKKSLASKSEVNKTLDDISKNTVPGVVFLAYSDSDNKLVITFRAANFNDVSKQVFAFKQADFISDVNVKNILRDEKGVKCEIEMKVKS